MASSILHKLQSAVVYNRMEKSVFMFGLSKTWPANSLLDLFIFT